MYSLQNVRYKYKQEKDLEYAPFENKTKFIIKSAYIFVYIAPSRSLGKVKNLTFVN